MNSLIRHSPLRASGWDPLQDFERMENRIARFLRRQTANLETEAASFADWSPSVDICEDDKEFLVKAELPEMKKEEVKVSVEDGVLQISGERKMEKEESGKRYHRVERAYGSFSRGFTLPEGADPSKITAEFKDGILNVHIAKTDKAKSKAVEVKVN